MSGSTIVEHCGWCGRDNIDPKNCTMIYCAQKPNPMVNPDKKVRIKKDKRPSNALAEWAKIIVKEEPTL